MSENSGKEPTKKPDGSYQKDSIATKKIVKKRIKVVKKPVTYRVHQDKLADLEHTQTSDQTTSKNPNRLSKFIANYLPNFPNFKKNKKNPKTIPKITYQEIDGIIIPNQVIKPANQDNVIQKLLKNQAKKLKKIKKENYVKNDYTNKYTKLSNTAKSSYFRKNIIDLLGYDQFVSINHRSYLSLKMPYTNKPYGLAQILKITGAGLDGLNEDNKLTLITNFQRFLHRFPQDFTFFDLEVPSDMTPQANRWIKKLKDLNLELNSNHVTANRMNQINSQKEIIIDTLNSLKYAEQNLISRSMYLLVYQEMSHLVIDSNGQKTSALQGTAQQLSQKVNNIINFDKSYYSLGLSIPNLQEQRQFLHQLNNPLSTIKLNG